MPRTRTHTTKRSKVPVKVSARHLHVTPKDFEKLFGKTDPTLFKKLGQSQFAAKETVTLVNGKRRMEHVRIVAHFRDKTQVELSITDAIKLGVKPVIRISGNIAGTPAITIEGPKGRVRLTEGVIVSQRHLHINPDEAKKLKLQHKDVISVLIEGKRETLFGNVVVRVHPEFDMCVHLDSDEGNAAGVPKEVTGYLVYP